MFAGNTLGDGRTRGGQCPQGVSAAGAVVGHVPESMQSPQRPVNGLVDQRLRRRAQRFVGQAAQLGGAHWAGLVTQQGQKHMVQPF